MPAPYRSQSGLPRASLVPDGRQKAAIYDAALEIMATVGQRVHDAAGGRAAARAGCEVEGDNLVRVPRELVEKTRATAPPVVEVYDRAGEPAMSLGRYNAYFGNGSAVTNVWDLETGEHRPTVLADGVMAARLVRRPAQRRLRDELRAPGRP